MADINLQLPVRPFLDPSDNKSQWLPDKEYIGAVNLWVDAFLEEAKGDCKASSESSECQKYIDYISGKQWSGRRPSYRSSPVDNNLWSTFWELVSTLTDVRPVSEVKPIRKTLKEFAKAAKAMTIAQRSWWLDTEADLALAKIIIYGILSTGYGKLQWNPALRNGWGEQELLPLGMNNVFPLKPKNSVADAEGIAYEEVQSLGWIRQKFPVLGQLVEPDPEYSRNPHGTLKPNTMSGVTWENISPQMKRLIGTSIKSTESVYPSSLYQEFWIVDRSVNKSNRILIMGEPGTSWSYAVGPDKPLYPRGRLIVRAGKVVLHDGPNPYSHGEFPFGDLRLNIVPWQFFGLSEMKSLLPLQDVINNIFAGVLDMVKKAVNPGFFGPKNAFSDSLWQSLDWSMPGQKAGYSANIAQKPEFAPPPQLPSWVLQVADRAARSINRNSAIATSAEMIQKKQVPGAETFDKVTRAQNSPMRLKGRNIEAFVRRMGKQSMFNMCQFYNDDRTLYIQENRKWQDFDWKPSEIFEPGISCSDFAKNFAFFIQPDSLLDLDQNDRAFKLQALRKGKDIDRITLLEELDLGIDIPRTIANLKQEAAEAQQFPQPMPSKGGGKSPRMRL